MALIGILMDSIETIKPYKDSTFAMMLAAQELNHKIRYFNQDSLYVEDGEAKVVSQFIAIKDNTTDYYQLSDKKTHNLDDFDVILMRKDPPFDMEFIYTTYILEMAERNNTIIVNPPNSLRKVNEKFFINYFPECIPKTIVSRDLVNIKRFINENENIVLKPMDGMGGAGIFKVSKNDANLNVILETLGEFGKNTIMAQKYLDKVVDGDKRILLVDGEPATHGLARIPQGKEFRANIAAGGKGVVQELTDRELWICQQIKPKLRELGLLFVGIDIIGGYMTEINVTSPTCIREIEAETNQKIAKKLIEIAVSKSKKLNSNKQIN